MSDPATTQGILCTDQSTGTIKVRRYLLRVSAGPDAGLERALEGGTVLLGTHAKNDLVLSDRTVSRYHLEIQVRPDSIRITDLDSTNGTYLGETRLGTVVVRARTRLRVGGETEIQILPAEEDVSVARFADPTFGKVYGASRPMADLFTLLSQVAPTDTTVLLQGETGAGKELVAEAIHEASPRRDRSFVVVDCGAMPRELVGAELFGHTRGAFTGATSAKRGLADEAEGGTLFLDEVGELPLDLQPQFLRVLEKREIRPVGETRPHKIDVRVIAATNRDLRAMVHAGQFREDLYFRLAVFQLVVPPLRQRPDDIPALVRLFLGQMGKSDFDVPEAVMQQLLVYHWPGNVRELRNVVQRGMSLAEGERPSAEKRSEGALQEVKSGVTPLVLELPFKEAKSLLVEAFEKEYLTHLLERHQGNISRAAAEAGIDRNYIHRLIKKYGLPVPR
jgi:transcriptional regulator with GAF, ATPase, and Fis domain